MTTRLCTEIPKAQGRTYERAAKNSEAVFLKVASNIVVAFSECEHVIRRGFGVAACLALPHWYIDTTVFPLSALTSAA